MSPEIIQVIQVMGCSLSAEQILDEINERDAEWGICWRAYVPKVLRSKWHDLPIECRLAIFGIAESHAERTSG